MATFYTPSDVSNGTLRDGHRFDVSKPGRRIKASTQFGANGARTIGVVEATCPSCIEDFTNNLRYATNPDKVELTADEHQYVAGTLLQGKAVLFSAIEQLQAIAKAEGQ